MQTFLPYPDIVKSIKCLDNKRLGKQRVEAYQIYKIVSGQDSESRWKNHPAVKMWLYHPAAIAMYMNIAINEWCQRGYINNMKYILHPIGLKLLSHKEDNLHNFIDIQGIVNFPWWIGNEEFHNAHKSNLLRKMPEHYSKFGWDVPNNLPYVWPV